MGYFQYVFFIVRYLRHNCSVRSKSQYAGQPVFENQCVWRLEHVISKMVKVMIVVKLLFICILISSCAWSGEKTTTLTTPILSPTPQYLLLVTPTGEITQSAYDASFSTSMWFVRGVAVSVWTDRLGVAKEGRNWGTLEKRASLYLNGNRISDETLVGGLDGEQDGTILRFSWTPDLDPGSYEAAFQFKTDSGEVVEYRWQFRITNGKEE